MRKKFIKSSRPTYKKRIRKGQTGMKFASYNVVETPKVDITDITNPINPFSEYNYNTTYDKPTALVVPTREDSKPDTIEEPDVVANNPTVVSVINKPVASKVTYTPKSYKGLAAFNKAYDEVEASNPEAKKYRQFLTKMAEQESGFDSAIQNRAGAPAYGYFQFMQDDKKYNNIRQYAGTDIETFRNNPKLQIEAAIKLAKSFEKGFSKEDLELANKNGYSTWGLLGGAWLAGNGGVRKFLRGQGNPSDRHWSKEGKGTDVATRIKAFNFKEGGIVKYQNPPHGIARRDAIQDYRPEIPFSPIKQPVKPYMPTQQPILSPDNRTGWEKEVSRQIKADRAKNENLYGNQHTWNWSAPFTNARITKDNASAMFDFDKSAAMSTFAIGQGIASPVTTATSIAGSLVGAGIGNKVAGEKGALVGGFVGGMVNPKFGMRFNKKNGFRGDAASARNATTTPRFNISKESLPDYAKPNWQGDQFALLKERLANGGFDRLERVSGGKAQTDKLIQTAIKMGMSPRELNPYANDFSPAFRQKILSSEPRYGTAESFKVAPHLGGFSDRRGDYYAITTEHIAKHTPSVVSSTKAHELAHYTYNPHEVPPMSVYKLPNDNPSRNYLMGFGTKEDGTELTARGTQIKGYYGLKEEHPITEDMLKYAADNYVKDTGYDNNMTDFFKGIIDYKEMAKWLTERSPLLILPTLNTKNYENGNNNK